MKNKMKKLVALALAAVMAVSMVACGGGEEGGSTEVTYKDTFTFAIGGEANYLDPALAGDSVSAYIVDNIYYPLFKIGTDGSIENEACESYDVTVNEDGNQVYTLHLVEKNNWSDGTPVTAADYVYGMKRSLGMGQADSTYSTFIANYVLNAKPHSDAMSDVADMDDVGIKALDDKTIEITLDGSCPFFVSLMCSGVFYPIHSSVPEHDYTWADDPSYPSNGPYQLKEIDRASTIKMVKNEHFTHADKVVTPNLVAKNMPDTNAQLIAFQTGEIDHATTVDTTVIKLYEGQPELIIEDSVINYFIAVNSKTGSDALKDVRVRRALQLGLDRSKFITALDAGNAYYELFGLVPYGIGTTTGDFRREADDAGAYVYTDKEEAKALLKAAGYDENNPLKLEYYYSQSDLHSLVADVLKSEWAEINVQIEQKTGELRTFFDDRSNGLFDMARHAMSADYMDPMTYLEMAASWYQGNVVTWGDDHYDQLIKESRELDGAERYAKLAEAEKYLVEEMAYTNPLFGYKLVTLMKDGTTGVAGSPQGNHKYWYVQCPA